MTTYTWEDQRNRATKAFNGETPVTPELEQAIIDVFQQNPVLVVQAIDRIADAFQAGRIHSGWAILRIEVERASTDQPGKSTTATDRQAKAAAIKRAENWIQTSGIHFDRESEIVDELFGDRCSLKTWKDEADLVARMTTCWAEHRPVGEQLEADELERAERWKATRQAVAAKVAADDWE